MQDDRSLGKNVPAYRTRADSVYRHTKSRIIGLQLQPGSIIQEEALAKELGVSRTPVREALRRLGQEGLVETIAKKGTLVTQISPADIHHVFQIRIALEPLAARLAVRSIPPNVLTELTSIHKPPKASGPGIIESYRELHRAICQYCGNPRLRRIIEQLVSDCARMLGVANYDHRLRSLEEHVQIIDALEKRDGARAERRMREHLRASQQRLARTLAS